MMRPLSLLLVILFLFTFLNGGVEGNLWCYDTLGLSLHGIQQGRVWQLVSYGFLHGNWWHVVINAVMLYLLGERLQSLIGWSRSLWVMLAGILLGGVLHLMLSLILGDPAESLLVGVSGGVMAVLLCLTSLQPYRVLWPLRLQARHLGSGFLISSLGLVLLMPSLGVPGLSQCGLLMVKLFGEEVFQASHACHLGGGIAGVLMAKLWIQKC